MQGDDGSGCPVAGREHGLSPLPMQASRRPDEPAHGAGPASCRAGIGPRVTKKAPRESGAGWSGGGGGNRTRVHECSSDGSTCVADLFESRRAFSQSAGRRTASHWISITGVVTPPASSLCVCRCCGLCGSACASLRPDLAQGPASAASHRGLGGESETLVVGVCSVPDGFTRSLVLGMPRTDSLPASKPGRPQHLRLYGPRWVTSARNQPASAATSRRRSRPAAARQGTTARASSPTSSSTTSSARHATSGSFTSFASTARSRTVARPVSSSRSGCAGRPSGAATARRNAKRRSVSSSPRGRLNCSGSGT